MIDDHRHGFLPRFSVGRPVTVAMTLVTILVLGFIAYSRIRIALFPEGFDEKTLVVFVNIPNATPTDVEQTVLRPIEDIVGTIPGVKSTFGRASSGNAFLRISFQADVDLDDSYAELRDRMDRVMTEMPEEVERIYVRNWDENDIPIIAISVRVPEGVDHAEQALETYVQPALQRIDGVGAVEFFALESKQVIIEMRQDRIAAYNIDMSTLMRSLRGQDANLSGGWVMDGGFKFYVRSLGRFTSLEEIENLIIEPATGLRVRDVATVAYRQPKRERVYRIDGHPSIGMEVLRSAGGNIVNISKAVRATLLELQDEPHLKDIRYEVIFDQGEHVQESIDNLRNTGLWGGLFAAIILFMFLRAPRMTGIITLAIPLSLLMTVIVLYFIGWTLNLVTMMGLLLSVGLVVDNSIVIVENIYRKRQEGVEARKASIEGAGEVGLAIVMATLTTVVVFLPLILMGGDQEFSFYMLRLGIPVIVSLLASLFIALIFIPLAALRLSRGTKHADLGFVAWMRRRYVNILRGALKHRFTAVSVIALAMASFIHPWKNIQRTDQHGGGDGEVRLFIEMPSGQSLEQADAYLKSVETQIDTKREEYDIARIETRFWANNGRISIERNRPKNTEWYAAAWRSILEVTGSAKPRMTREEIEKDLKKLIVPPPGYRIRNSWRDSGDSGEASASVTLYGEDTETLLALSGEVERRLLTIPEIIEVDTETDRAGQELQIQLDRDQARRLGIEPQAVSSNISNTLRGARLSDYRTPGGREVEIRVQLEEGDATTVDDVRRLSFRNRTGELVPLESVASLYVTRTLGQIRREDRHTMLRVTARAQQKDTAALFAAVDQAMAGMDMPRGYRWDKGSRWMRMQETNEAGGFALLMAISFVFFLMGVLFESFLLPLAVIIAVPFAFLGVAWTLYLTGTPFDMMSTIGAVVLVGVVVNNAIVLVDLVNRLRSQGMPRFEALVQAAHDRFRPILMTTFTTACGLIPMAFGDTRMMDMSYAPLGRTMMGGLLTATFLTLVIVPLFYTYLDDLRTMLMRVAGSVIRRDALPAADATGSAASFTTTGK